MDKAFYSGRGNGLLFVCVCVRARARARARACGSVSGLVGLILVQTVNNEAYSYVSRQELLKSPAAEYQETRALSIHAVEYGFNMCLD